MNSPEPSTADYWLNALFCSLSQNFTRSEPRTRAWHYLQNLIGSPRNEETVGRRNLACRAEDRRSDSAQRLLTTARWDDKQVRRGLLDFIASRYQNEKNTFFVIETSFAKKGNKATALSRQFSVDSNRLENCQIAVMLFYGTKEGHRFLVDCDLYVPRACIEDPATRRMLPKGTTYRSKSQIASVLIENAIRGGLTPSRALVALMCPDKTRIQHAMQARRIPLCMPLTSLDLLRSAEGGPVRSRSGGHPGPPGVRLQTGTVTTSEARPPSKRGYYYVYDPAAVTFQDVSHAAWELDQMRQAWNSARACVRFDRYSVRSMLGWHRHMTLAMVALTSRELARTHSSPQRPDAQRSPVPVR